MMPRTLVLLFLIVSITASAQQAIPTQPLQEIPLGPPSIQPGGGGAQPAIATDGRNFMVVSSDSSSPYFSYYYISLVDAESRLIGPSTYVFSGLGDVAAVASSGSSFLVVWGAHGGTTGALFDSAGQLVRTPFTIHPGSGIYHLPHDFSGRRAVAWTGREYVVLNLNEKLALGAWDFSLVVSRVTEKGDVLQTDIDTGFTSEVAAIASRNGVTIIATPTQYRVLGGNVVTYADRGRDVAIADDPSGFLIVFTTDTDISAVHLDPSGRATGPPFRIASVERAHAGVASTGAGYIVTWTDLNVVRPDPRRSINVQRFTGDGVALDPAPIVVANRRGAENAAVASDGRNSVIAWDENSAVFGAPLRSSADPVAVHLVESSQSNPTPFWLGTTARVAWMEGSNTFVTDGATTFMSEIGASPKPVAAGMLTSVVAGPSSTLFLTASSGGLYANVGDRHTQLDAKPNIRLAKAVQQGSSFVVIWATPDGLWTARLAADGTSVGSPRQVAAAPYSDDINMAASNDEVLVVFDDGRHVHGALVTQDAITPTEDIATPQDLATSLSVASDGSLFCVTWINHGGSKNDFIQGKLIDATGHVTSGSDPKFYSPGDDYKTHAASFWTGTEYLVVWARTTSTSLSPADVFALRVAPDGRLLDYPPIHVGSVDGEVTSIARSESGQLLVGYVRSSIHAPFYATRAFVRGITFPRRQSAPHQ